MRRSMLLVGMFAGLVLTTIAGSAAAQTPPAAPKPPVVRAIEKATADEKAAIDKIRAAMKDNRADNKRVEGQIKTAREACERLPGLNARNEALDKAYEGLNDKLIA